MGSSASKPDWWLEGGDKLPPLGGAPLSAKGDRTGVRGVAEAAAPRLSATACKLGLLPLDSMLSGNVGTHLLDPKT